MATEDTNSVVFTEVMGSAYLHLIIVIICRYLLEM